MTHHFNFGGGTPRQGGDETTKSRMREAGREFANELIGSEVFRLKLGLDEKLQQVMTEIEAESAEIKAA